MSDKKLTEKNKQAIEVYLGAGSQEAKGNGTKAWQEVYGTKNSRVAAKNWSRMVTNGNSQEYLERRRKEIEEVVTEKVAYGVEEATRDILEMKELAKSGAHTSGDVQYINAAVKASLDALRAQGLLVNKSESTSITGSPEDRQHAALLGLGLTEFLERKAAGTLPPPPEIPETRTQH